MTNAERDIEIIKAFSILWRTSVECCPNLDLSKGEEAHMSGNDPLHFFKLSKDEQEALTEWIGYALEPDEYHICSDDSYGIKHMYERDMGKYVTNGQFKGAMIHYGFDPVNPRDLNCYYRLKIKSDVLKT